MASTSVRRNLKSLKYSGRFFRICRREIFPFSILIKKRLTFIKVTSKITKTKRGLRKLNLYPPIIFFARLNNILTKIKKITKPPKSLLLIFAIPLSMQKDQQNFHQTSIP